MICILSLIPILIFESEVDPGLCWGPDTRGTVTSDTRLLITGGDGNTAVIRNISRTGGMLLSSCPDPDQPTSAQKSMT